MGELRVVDLGLIEYRKAVLFQKETLLSRQKGDSADTLILAEHFPVITISRRGNRENILADEELLSKEDIEVIECDRGGDVTYHGPGQLLAYPVLDLRDHGKNLHLFLRNLERVVIELLREFDIEAQSIEGLTGVWVKGEKISSVGVAVKNWVSYHGLSLNINPDFAHLSFIIPCGLKGKTQTSVARILGYIPNEFRIKQTLVEKFVQVFSLFMGSGLDNEADPLLSSNVQA